MKSDKKPSTKKTAKKSQKIPEKPARRGGVVRKKVLHVPPILLESDPGPDPIGEGPERRYDLAASESPRHLPPLEQRKELPEAYGTKTLLLMARDPHWLYAHWDLSREQLQQFNRLSIDHHLVLRIYIDRLAGEPRTIIHVHPESRNWFVHVGLGGRKYIAELGYHNADRTWVTICNSKPAVTPPNDVSKDTSAWFATISLDAPVETPIKAINNAARGSAPPPDAIQQLSTAQQPFLEQWTPTQEGDPAQAARMDEASGGGIGSLETTELFSRQFVSGLASAGVAQFPQPASWSGSVPGSLNPRSGMEEAKQFRFDINAELIVYGATEPDANVTIGGHPIKLRSDGTFSHRITLPDGSFHLPLVSLSSDNTDGRSAELTCSRKTEYRGKAGRSSAGPTLKDPNEV